MRVMLDTNAVSALMREPSGNLAQRIAQLNEPVSVSVVVAAELRYGAARKGSARLAAVVDQVLDSIEIEPFAQPADAVYGQLRHALDQQGRPIGANDLLIAAHALALGRVLITDDQAFTRIAGLAVENWVR